MSDATTIQDVLTLFPDQSAQALIRSVAGRKPSISPVAHLMEGQETMTMGKHAVACTCCADSRESLVLCADKILYARSPGSLMTDPHGKLTQEAKDIVLAAIEDKIPAIVVRQHSRCGAMGIIYNRFARPDGEEYVRDHYGQEFVDLFGPNSDDPSVATFNHLYNKVAKNVPTKTDAAGKVVMDFAHYENKYKMPLVGDDAAKFQTCMALEQNDADYAEIAAALKSAGADTKALYAFNHMAEGGTRYVRAEKGQPLIKLPHPDEEGFEDKLKDVQAKFPQELHYALRLEAVARKEWELANAASMRDRDVKLHEVQKPGEMHAHTSQANEMTGRMAGESFFFRLPDGSLGVDGQAKGLVAPTMALARAYGVKVKGLHEGDDDRTVRALYRYHHTENGAAEMVKEGMPFSIELAQRHKSISDSVVKNGMDHYVKMGVVTLTGDKQKDMEACFSVQKGLDNLAVETTLFKASCAAGSPLPYPVLFIEHEGVIKAFEPESKKFLTIKEPSGAVCDRPCSSVKPGLSFTK